jgi:hypothetical protein
MFFPDRDKAYREVRRVLVRGGHFLFSVWDAHRYNDFGRISHEIAGSFFPADPPQFYRVPFSCHQIDPIKDALLAVGFGDIEVAVARVEKEIADMAQFARGLVFGNPLADQIRERGLDPERVVEKLMQALVAQFGAERPRTTLQAIVFKARSR